MNRVNIKDFKAGNSTIENTCHYTFVKPIEYTTLRVNPNIKYKLWVTEKKNLEEEDRDHVLCVFINTIPKTEL